MFDDPNTEIAPFLSSKKLWRPNPIRKKPYQKMRLKFSWLTDQLITMEGINLKKKTSLKILSPTPIGKFV